MNHSKSCEALKKIVQEFADNSTTSQEQCGLDELKQAPLRRRQPDKRQRRPKTVGNNMVQSTPWVHNSAGPAKDAVTCPGTVPMARARAKARTTSARARAHTNGARATTTGTEGSNNGMYKGGEKANIPSCYGPVKVCLEERTPSWQVQHLRWRSFRTRLP